MENTKVNTLAEMGQVMKQWRAQKKYASEKIPDALRSQLLEIMAKYPHRSVAHALRLSSDTVLALRKMQHTLSSKQTAQQQPKQEGVHFIPFALPATASLAADKHAANKNEANSGNMCEIHHPNGAKLLITSRDLQHIIQAFLCCK